MKLYLLYAGQRFYPLGGQEDFVRVSQSLSDLVELMESLLTDDNKYYDWGHIVELDTIEHSLGIILEGSTPTGQTSKYTLESRVENIQGLCLALEESKDA
jgi:hypothetical protein